MKTLRVYFERDGAAYVAVYQERDVVALPLGP